jgi:hypothetical protein
MPQFDDRDTVCLQIMSNLAKTWIEQVITPPELGTSNYDVNLHFKRNMPSPDTLAQYAYGLFRAAIQEKDRELVEVPTGADVSAFAPRR